MNEIDIVKYISNWLILKNLHQKNKFDIIFFENIEKDIIKEYSDLNIKNIGEYWYDFSVNWKLINEIENNKNILIIIDKLNIYYLIPFIKKAKEKNIEFTIINLWAWISSAINKNILEINDIDELLKYDIQINEILDFVSFFEYIIKWWQRYIRIPHKVITGSINLEWSENFSSWEKILNLQPFWLEWNDWTLLIWASLIQDAIQFTALSREDWINLDTFCITDYNFNITKELVESIKKTEKLIIIIDQIDNSWVINKIKASLWDIWFIDCEIKTICPSTELKTKLQEYIWDDAKFNWEAIYKKIKSEF